MPKTSKQKKLEKAAAWAATVADHLGKPLDDGIKDTVIALRALGINTTMSCEGHLDHGITGPWVDIFSPAGVKVQDQVMAYRRRTKDIKDLPKRLRTLREQTAPGSFQYAVRIAKLVESFYKRRTTEFGCRIILIYWMDGEVRLTCQGAYPNKYGSKKDRIANLEKYQKEFKAFTEYLIQHL